MMVGGHRKVSKPVATWDATPSRHSQCRMGVIYDIADNVGKTMK